MNNELWHLYLNQFKKFWIQFLNGNLIFFDFNKTKLI